MEKYESVIEEQSVDPIPRKNISKTEFKSELYFISSIRKLKNNETDKNNKKVMRRYIILEISSNPFDEYKYLVITGGWINSITFSKGSVINTSANFKKGSFPPIFNDKYMATLTSGKDILVLYPHKLLYVRSLVSYGLCSRLAFLKNTGNYRNLSEKYTIISLKKQFIEELVKCRAQKKKTSIIQELIYKNKDILFLNDINEKKLISNIKNVIPIKMKENRDLPDFTVDSFKEGLRSTKLYPFYSSKNTRVKKIKNIRSFGYGLVGTIDFIGETIDEEPIPVDIYDKYIDTVRQDQLYHITGSVLLMNELYPELSNYTGFIWYINTDMKYVYTVNENNAHEFLMNRNRIISTIVENKIPPYVEVKHCSKCKYVRHCNLYKEMSGKNFNKSDLEFNTMKEKYLFGALMKRDFFWSHQRRIMKSLTMEMNTCMKISIYKLEYRTRNRMAITNLVIDEMKDQSIVLIPSENISFYNFAIKNHDMVLITKDGSMPVIGSGYVMSFSSKKISIHVLDIIGKKGDIVTIDFYDWNEKGLKRMSSLLDLLSEESRLFREIVLGRKSKITGNKCKFNNAGLSHDQIDVINKSLRTTKGYLLVNAPQGSKVLDTVLNLVTILLKNQKKVLIAPYFYSTIDTFCERFEHMGINFVLCGQKEQTAKRFQKYCEPSLFTASVEIEDTGRHIINNNLFITQAQRKSYLLERLGFDKCIILDATLVDMFMVTPLLGASTSYVLFGDPILEKKDSNIFTQLAKNAGIHAYLTGIKEKESALVNLMNSIWGGNLYALSDDMNISLKPMYRIHDDYINNCPIFRTGERNMLINYEKDFIKAMRSIISMKSPAVFVRTNSYCTGIVIALYCGLVYESIGFTSTYKLVQFYIDCVQRCISEDNIFFSNRSQFSDSASRIRILIMDAIRKERNDVIVVTTDNDESLLKLSLSSVKRKLIIISNDNSGFKPLHSIILRNIGNENIIKFPDDLLSRNIGCITVPNETFKFGDLCDPIVRSE